MSDNDDEPVAAYGNTHRAFLQALLSRQTITYEAAKPLLAEIQSAATPTRPTTAEDITQEDFEDYMNTIHDTITPFSLEIRSSLHQTSRERIYALVNTTSDAMTQMATVHTPDEIAFVKRVIDAMFDTYNTPQREVFALTGMQAIKLAKPPNERRDSGQQTQGAQAAALTMSQAEKVLESMVSEGWFDFSERGFYTLSQRALLELRHWLFTMYNESPEDVDEDEEPRERVKKCGACRDIVTIGQRCPNLPCNVRLHDHCTVNFFRAQRGTQQCNICQTDWVDAPPVGEKAAARNGAGAGGRRSTNGTAGRRSMANGTHDESDADEGASD